MATILSHTFDIIFFKHRLNFYIRWTLNLNAVNREPNDFFVQHQSEMKTGEKSRKTINNFQQNLIWIGAAHRRILMRCLHAVFSGHVILLFSYPSWETGMVWWHSSDYLSFVGHWKLHKNVSKRFFSVC